MPSRPVSIVTVTRDGLFFTRLLTERVRATVRDRPYEIIVVDQGSRDGTVAWAKAQPDIHLLMRRHWLRRAGHRHDEAAEKGARAARHEHIVLLASDAFPMTEDWLARSVDLIDDTRPIAGALFPSRHRDNPRGWYIHPHFMAFRKRDLGTLVVLRRPADHATDAGEEATLRVLAAGGELVGHDIDFCPEFDVGHPHLPTIAGGIVQSWYASRLLHDEAEVLRETAGRISRARYLDPLMARLKAAYPGAGATGAAIDAGDSTAPASSCLALAKRDS